MSSNQTILNSIFSDSEQESMEELQTDYSDSVSGTESLNSLEQPSSPEFDTGIESKNESKNQEEKIPEEVSSCNVCYTELKIENTVSTNCNHLFCRKCFFRWIEMNATCPVCRAPIDSKTNLTEEQMSAEMSDTYQMYQSLLLESNRLLRSQMRLNKELFSARTNMIAIQATTNGLMRRQISLREQIDKTRGYNEGQLAALYTKTKIKKAQKYSSYIFDTMKECGIFKGGFNDGYMDEITHLDKIMHKNYKVDV